jgi:hypothetical protein
MHSRMILFRAVLSFMVAGALLGILSVTLMGPKLITWDNTAGNGDGMCLCGLAAGRGADTLITYQMRGVGGGAALGTILGLVVVLQRRKKAGTTAAPPA